MGGQEFGAVVKLGGGRRGVREWVDRSFGEDGWLFGMEALVSILGSILEKIDTIDLFSVVFINLAHSMVIWYLGKLTLSVVVWNKVPKQMVHWHPLDLSLSTVVPPLTRVWCLSQIRYSDFAVFE